MPVVIKFEAPNMEKVDAELTRLGNVDLTDAWPLVRERLFRIEAEQFASQGAAGMHGEWDPLDEDYQLRKEKKWAITEIERASGRLFYSLTGETEDSVFESTSTEMTFGTRVPYALYQQTGFRTRLGQHVGKFGKRHEQPFGAKREHVPARRLFDFTDEQVHRIAEVIATWYAAKARRAGFKVLGRQAEGPGEARIAGRTLLDVM